MAEVDQEGEILQDGTLSVYVGFSHQKLTFFKFVVYSTCFLTVEKFNFFTVVKDKQLQSFTSGLAIHQLIILQNQ